MTSMPQYNHHCTTWLDKGYTTFTWSVKDWRMIRDHYKSIVSPEFVLHNTDGKTCSLNFQMLTDHRASVDVQFPAGIQYHTMEATVSFLSVNLIRDIKAVRIFQTSDTCYLIEFSLSLSTEDMIKYVRNNTLTLFFELSIFKSVKDSAIRTEIQDADFATDICKNFTVILDSKELHDVTFVIGEKKLYAHKVILAANSKVFRAMFTTEMKELKDSIVEIVDTEAAVFEAFLGYMYTGQVSKIENVVDELIVLADKYEVMNLKKLCERYMLKHINDDTVITYLLKAYQLSCNDLQKNCIDFVGINIHVLGNSPVLAKLSEYPSIVSQVFDKKQSA